jgi:two-component system sensor histidine kinase KdpD
MEAQVFTKDEIRLLEAFADEAALAVDRDRLLEKASRVQALQQTDQLKSALLSAVSHDLRTPLASIKASVSSLLQDDVSWDEASRREFLSAIDEETDRLTRLVGNLLDLSRIEGGALRPEKDWYDIAELLETVVARMERTLGGHQLQLTVADDVGEVALDYVQISQVVTNLLENASHAAPAGTAIELIAERRGGEVEIVVEDEGPGIPAEERQRIFDKFYRLVSAGQKGSGSGLGLAISKGFVEAHGGAIRAEAAPGGGARFVVTLPAPAAPAPPATPAYVAAP